MNKIGIICSSTKCVCHFIKTGSTATLAFGIKVFYKVYYSFEAIFYNSKLVDFLCILPVLQLIYRNHLPSALRTVYCLIKIYVIEIILSYRITLTVKKIFSKFLSLK